jgi:RNA polymerase sigma factor (sigma-70 family)
VATDDHADTIDLDPIDERAVTTALSREAPIWAQIADETPATPPETARWEADDLVIEIYRTHYSQLVRLAIMLVHDTPTAEEVVQDAFQSMHLAWRRLRDTDMALSYLRQAVVNRARSVLRHRAVSGRHAPQAAPDEPSAEESALALLEAITLRYYADLSEADIAAAMGISRGAVKSHTARAMVALRSILKDQDETGQTGSWQTVVIPVSIYLADEAIHADVEAAVEAWLVLAKVAIEDREPPIIGSWFRRIRATAKVALESEAARDLSLTAVHAVDTRIVLAQDAAITATLMANLAPVIASLQPTKDAVLRVGALLIVKVDWTVQVIQLTAAQQAVLDHQPQLASAPHQVVAALQLPQPVDQRPTSSPDLSRP